MNRSEPTYDHMGYGIGLISFRRVTWPAWPRSEGATGRSLQGAIVKVAGTTAVDYTDAEGHFTLPGVPAGTYTVEIEYVGLDPFKQSVTVTADRTATVTAELRSEVLQMAAFEVAEAARGQALAINQQKTARGIVNIVSEVSWRFTRKFRVQANVINATKRPQVSYQSFPAYVEDNSMSAGGSRCAWITRSEAGMMQNECRACRLSAGRSHE
ncbi:MAG: carboxypeptidase-like regulatory domain-containing protein [Opitutaceae bacterium]|nr:carboxypeptidase-like regulatory domain-containing protein [Opitutaceae bacterium]